jgi:hypothetical protein
MPKIANFVEITIETQVSIEFSQRKIQQSMKNFPKKTNYLFWIFFVRLDIGLILF